MGLKLGFLGRLRKKYGGGPWNLKKKTLKEHKGQEQQRDEESNKLLFRNGKSRTKKERRDDNIALIVKQQQQEEERSAITTKGDTANESEEEVMVDDIQEQNAIFRNERVSGNTKKETPRGDMSKKPQSLTNQDDTDDGMGLVPVSVHVQTGSMIDDCVSAISFQGACPQGRDPSNNVVTTDATIDQAKNKQPVGRTSSEIVITQGNCNGNTIVGSNRAERVSSNKQMEQETTAIEVMLQKTPPDDAEERTSNKNKSNGKSPKYLMPYDMKRDPSGHDLTTGAGAEEILASLHLEETKHHLHRPTSLNYNKLDSLGPPHAATNNNHHYIPNHLLPNNRKKPKNSLIKYQKQQTQPTNGGTKAVPDQQHKPTTQEMTNLKPKKRGHFRYIERGTEDNDISLISI